MIDGPNMWFDIRTYPSRNPISASRIYDVHILFLTAIERSIWMGHLMSQCGLRMWLVVNGLDIIMKSSVTRVKCIIIIAYASAGVGIDMTPVASITNGSIIGMIVV
jgi:hypothetical protein